MAPINPLAPKFTFKFLHTLYLKCEYTGTKKGSIMK